MLHLIDRADPEAPVHDTLTLPFEQRQKSRQRVTLASGREAGILLTPGTRLHDGDVLRAASGERVRVCAAIEELSTARSADALQLARASYHLGNRHVPVQIGAGWVRYAHDHVLDDMLRQMGLPVTVESAPFEPEAGAYAGGHRHGHAHEHAPDESAHGHDHAHDHGHGHGHSH
jgi:urease accessory protein